MAGKLRGKKGNAKKRKAKSKKNSRSKRDRDWELDGGGSSSVQLEEGEEQPPVKRARRVTAEIQDRQQRLALIRKKHAYMKEITARFIPEPGDDQGKKTKRKKRRRNKKAEANGAEADPHKARYAWIRGMSLKDEEQQELAPGDGEEDGSQAIYRKLLQDLSGSKAMASSKYKAILDQRRKEQEGITSDGEEESEEEDEEEEEAEEEDEEEEEEEEEEEDEEEGEEEEGQAITGIEDGNDPGGDRDEEEAGDGNLDDEGDDDEGEGVDEDGAAEAEDPMDEGHGEGAAGDDFTRHFCRGALADTETSMAGVGHKLDLKGRVKDDGQEDVISIYGNPAAPYKVDGLAALGQLPGLHVRKVLEETWSELNQRGDLLTELQAALLPCLSAYKDVFFSALTNDNLLEVNQLVLLHVLNHLLKARMRVLRHNRKRRDRDRALKVERMAQAMDEAAEDEEGISEGENGKMDKHGGNKDDRKGVEVEGSQDSQDQGFTRPKVLVLLPMRNLALKFVEEMVAMLGPKVAVSGLQRFRESYGVPADEKEDEDEGRTRKPLDWQELFQGNLDDDFKLGISLTPGQGKGSGTNKGVAVKLYSEFYVSDLIVASPLGLKLAMEEKQDHDFLSSVEVVVLQQADVLFMQNWDHVMDVAKCINLPPKRDHNTDFSRVREWFLEGQAAKFRQTLILSRWSDPLMTALFNRSCQSYEGKVRMKREVSRGSICDVALRVKQVFQRVPCQDARSQGDAKLDHFIKLVLSGILQRRQSHVLVFIPSYFDFIRVRNHLIKEDISHACISEYERGTETARGRSRFFHGQRDILLYTGRAHFFRRYMIRGAQHLVFYGLPECPHFYPELVNLLEEADTTAVATSCLALFTRFEAMALERIVGTERSLHMLSSEKGTYLFC